MFGGTQGEALETLRKIAAETLPQGYTLDYGGESRQFMQESGGFIATLSFAIIIIFLVLAAQFESFRDPLVVMMSVPMAIFGAVVFLFLGFATLNVYTQVGLVTLVGLIAKHGILIVQFANDQQHEGKSKREAIEAAATIRLRPILMTTFSMVFGVVPMVFASGAGAAGRSHMGFVIFTGISIGTLFTLFVVPAMYMFLGAEHQGATPPRGAARSGAVQLAGTHLRGGADRDSPPNGMCGAAARGRPAKSPRRPGRCGAQQPAGGKADQPGHSASPATG